MTFKLGLQKLAIEAYIHSVDGLKDEFVEMVNNTMQSSYDIIKEMNISLVNNKMIMMSNRSKDYCISPMSPDLDYMLVELALRAAQVVLVRNGNCHAPVLLWDRSKLKVPDIINSIDNVLHGSLLGPVTCISQAFLECPAKYTQDEFNALLVKMLEMYCEILHRWVTSKVIMGEDEIIKIAEATMEFNIATLDATLTVNVFRLESMLKEFCEVIEDNTGTDVTCTGVGVEVDDLEEFCIELVENMLDLHCLTEYTSYSNPEHRALCELMFIDYITEERSIEARDVVNVIAILKHKELYKYDKCSSEYDRTSFIKSVADTLLRVSKVL